MRHRGDSPGEPPDLRKPSIWQALAQRGHRVSKHRVTRLMCIDGLRAKTVKTWRVPTQSYHRLPVAVNALNRQFTVTKSNRVCAGNITYIWTAVVGCILRQALTMAIHHRDPKAGLLHHSDRGSQYASTAYQQLLVTHGMAGSMSRQGNGWDNPCVESFFGTLKAS